MKKRKTNDIQEAIDVFESGYYTQPNYDAANGKVSYTKAEAPVFRSVRRLKMSRPDYKYGPVRVYTEQEIKEYEDAKAE